MLGETAGAPSSEEEEEKEEEEEDSLSFVDDEDDKDYSAEEDRGRKTKPEETAKRRGARAGRKGDRRRKKVMEEEEEDVTVGDVFALEMELNRENKKLMKVRRTLQVFSLLLSFLLLRDCIVCLSRGVAMAASCLRP